MTLACDGNGIQIEPHAAIFIRMCSIKDLLIKMGHIFVFGTFDSNGLFMNSMNGQTFLPRGFKFIQKRSKKTNKKTGI